MKKKFEKIMEQNSMDSLSNKPRKLRIELLLLIIFCVLLAVSQHVFETSEKISRTSLCVQVQGGTIKLSP